MQNQIYINLHCRCAHPELNENTYFIYVGLNNVRPSHFMPRCHMHEHAKITTHIKYIDNKENKDIDKDWV